MGKVVSRIADDLPASVRQSIEGIIESPLATNEQVIAMTYVPGATLVEDLRSAARTELDRLRLRAGAFQYAQGIALVDIDVPCDEAVQAAGTAQRK